MATLPNTETRKRKFLDKQDLINFNDPATCHDRILVVQEKKFYVNAGILSMSSEHFRTMFNSSFAEAKQQEIVLKDVSARAFNSFLKMIYPPHLTEPVSHTLRSVALTPVLLELLSLSFRFLCPTVYQAVTQYIKDEFERNRLKIFDLVQFIELAVLHDIAEFKEMVIKSLRDPAFATENKEGLMNAPVHVKDFVLAAYLDGSLTVQPSSPRAIDNNVIHRPRNNNVIHRPIFARRDRRL